MKLVEIAIKKSEILLNEKQQKQFPSKSFIYEYTQPSC